METEQTNNADLVTEMFDACINPMAQMMCNLLGFLAKKGTISKNEAKFVIASSVDVLKQLQHF